MMRAAITALVTALGLGLLAGCAPETPDAESVDSTAACVMRTSSPERLRAMGESYGLDQTAGLKREDAWSCDTRWSMVFSSDFRKEVGRAVTLRLVPDAHAREGMYAVTAGLALNRAQRTTLGRLGAFLDKSHAAAVQALMCESVEPHAAMLVSRLDLPFATAVLGIQADIGNPQMAQTLAEKLIERVDLLVKDLPVADCAQDDGKARFTEYAKDMHRFYQGAHPWAPGCSVRNEGEDLTLVCGGTQAASKK